VEGLPGERQETAQEQQDDAGWMEAASPGLDPSRFRVHCERLPRPLGVLPHGVGRGALRLEHRAGPMLERLRVPGASLWFAVRVR
jgi:hypothetical protein